MRLHRLGAALLCLMVLAGCELIFLPQDEGTEDDPVEITVGFSHYGSVSDWGTSYYSFVSLAGGFYTISLTGVDLDSDLSWHLYDSSRLWMVTECNKNPAGGDEEMTDILLDPYQTYYLRVEQWNWAGDRFYLAVNGP